MTVAGSDSGGGAGIQADLKTFAALKVFGTSAITALTVQNSIGVTGIHNAPPEIIKAQILAVGSDFPLGAVKTGMLGNRGTIRAVAEGLSELGIKKIVVDPVMVAQSGDSLLAADAVEAVKEIIVPLAQIVTPNLPEAEKLTGMRIESVEEMTAAAREIAKLGCGAVLVKGGHLAGEPEIITDVLLADGKISLLQDRRIETTANHGTGCTLSSAIAAELAAGLGLEEAVARARQYLRAGLHYGVTAGHGAGCLGHAVTMPWTEIVHG
ncbi:MAG: bifunctional hydroxymethylpyrimidine kinase/phosphomethylpyrimidine kinase [Cloacibacillus porcorum]|nr:bifunctional hydroxymethylpyrimidine kinase/phosphomethylpyrimidine kinase [Cloacibacillus porcorum]MCI5865214.1 bifunctional hydroxymethylpyrimidine kinase/phosphomethylpyrimidine kinase [Cloacibacillus porcorum]